MKTADRSTTSPNTSSGDSGRRRLYGLGIAIGISKLVFRKLSRWLRRSKRFIAGSMFRSYPDLMGALSDDFPKRRHLLRLESIAFLLGDHASAARFARRRALRGDTQSLFISLLSQWSTSDAEREVALERVSRLTANGDDNVLEAVARFYVYLEDPREAEATLALIDSPSHRLLTTVGSLSRRHGFGRMAVRLFRRAQAQKPNDPLTASLIEATLGEIAAGEWTWLQSIDRDSSEYSPEPRRVLHMVARSLPHHHAGSTYRTHYTLTAQRQGGLDACAVTECGFPGSSISANGVGPGEVYEGIEYLRLPRNGSSGRLDRMLLSHFAAASQLVTTLRPAALHPHSDYRNAAVALALRERFGIPVVYEVRGFPEEYLPRRPASRMLYERFGTRRQIEAECWRRADRVVTLAEVMKDHIASKGVERDRIHVVPNAVDADRFRPVERDQPLASYLGIEPDDSVIGYVSSLTAPYEGVRYLIEAVAELTRRGKQTKALVVGEGSERPHLMEVAKRLGVDDRVIFTGRVDHNLVPSHYSLIDIFVVPRTSEATTELVTPLKPLEAMAMERPVVVSGTRALREMIIEGKTGLSYEPDNVESLVDTVEPLMDDPVRRLEMGRTARQWVIENRSWAHNAEIYKSIYADLGVAVG